MKNTPNENKWWYDKSTRDSILQQFSLATQLLIKIHNLDLEPVFYYCYVNIKEALLQIYIHVSTYMQGFQAKFNSHQRNSQRNVSMQIPVQSYIFAD